MEQRVNNCEGDHKNMFSLIYSLLRSKTITVLSEYTSPFLCFIEKFYTIKMEFPHLEMCLPAYSFALSYAILYKV